MAKGEVMASTDELELAILGEGAIAQIEDDPAQIARDMSKRILSAESEEDIFSEDSTLSAEDLLDVPLFIESVRWLPSTKEGDGPNVYAVINGKRGDDGSDVLITCGGQRVMLQLLQAQRLNLYPLQKALKFLQIETARKRKTLRLVPA